jgi:hypothetical protein
MTDDNRCTHVKPDGSRCRAKARKNKTCCMFHDPALAAERRAGRRRGGRRGERLTVAWPADTPEVPLRTVPDLVNLLEKVINDLLRGKLGVRLTGNLGVLAAAQLRALEVGDLEQRLSDIEEQLQAGTNGRIYGRW